MKTLEMVHIKKKKKSKKKVSLEPTQIVLEAFHCGSDGKESACNVGDADSISRLGRSLGGENGSPC